MSSSKNPSKKDKGKAVQKAEDYQLQVPTKNQFLPLQNFPPLPYKTAVSNPAPSPNSNDAYIVCHVEHLLLTSCKTLPQTNVISSILQKTFGSIHYATDEPRRTQQFYELILVDTKSASITHTPNKFNPSQILYSECIIKNVLNAQQWKNPFEESKFSVTLTPQTFNYHDYKNAWYRTFLLQPNVHSWFFDFHDSCSNIFPIWFYDWWIWFGCAPVVFPLEANEG